MRWTILALVAAVAAALTLLPAPRVLACGGLFCSSATTVPAPVDQNAERIVFEVGEGTITAHIQIQFVGTAADFAWVVPIGSLATEVGGAEPVPGEGEAGWEWPALDGPGDWSGPATRIGAADLPALRALLAEQGPIGPLVDVDESTAEWFDWIDSNTRLQILLPAGEACADGSFAPGSGSGGSGGCLGGAYEQSAGSANDGWEYDDGPRQTGPVTVFGEGRTDHYEFHVIGAERTADLVTWLQGNQYNVSDNMTPVMDVYNAPGAMFLALKLRRDVDVTQIAPVALTYRGQHPSIPIRLTAVAAQPLMGIQVFILGEQPYAAANYENLRPAGNEILFDSTGRTSYFDWVARAVDEADGHAFVAELVSEYYRDGSGNPAFLSQVERDLCEQYGDYEWEPCSWEFAGYVSRFYARVSPHQMTLDPVFVPARAAQVTTNVVDLSRRQSPVRCGEVIEEREPSECAFNYCGSGAECTVRDGQVGCLCLAGDVAQAFRGPDGGARVTCVPEESPYSVTPEAVGAGGPFDPCVEYDCGGGLCVLRGGFPTCACEDGMVGVLADSGRTRCVAVRPGIEVYGPGAGPEAGTVAMVAPIEPTRRAGGDIEWAIVLVLLAYGARLGRQRAS